MSYLQEMAQKLNLKFRPQIHLKNLEVYNGDTKLPVNLVSFDSEKDYAYVRFPVTDGTKEVRVLATVVWGGGTNKEYYDARLVFKSQFRMIHPNSKLNRNMILRSY